MILSCLDVVHIPQYNNVLKRWHHKVDTMTNQLFWGREVFLYVFNGSFKQLKWKGEVSKPPKTHILKNLVLIAESKKIIWRNSGVSTIYTFLHVDFDSVDCYTARRYVHLKKEVIEELLCKWGRGIRWLSTSSFRVNFVSTTKGGWCWNFGLIMFGFRAKLEPHLWWHGWSRAPRHFCELQQRPFTWKHSIPWKITLTQLEEVYSWRPEWIISPRQSNNLHNTFAAFKNCSREEVMKMAMLEMFLILFPVDNLKYIPIP